jgi:hypothetical protein
VELPVESGLAHRCEACGLGVMSKSGSTADAIVDLGRGADDDGSVLFANKASLQAFVTGGAWSELGSGHSYAFTPEAIRRLIATRDQIVDEIHWRPGTAILNMWQSGINMFTFGHNLALSRFGRAVATPARKSWQRLLDGFITIVLAVPAMLFAVPIELIGGLFRHGGSYRVNFKVL